MSELMIERLKRRKLDALRRGVHRENSDEALAVSNYIVGIGKAGIGVISHILRSITPSSPKVHALAVDIGEHDLLELRTLAATAPQDRADVTIVSLDVPKTEVLLDGLRHYPQFLKLEYPRYTWESSFEPWLEPTLVMPTGGAPLKRAVAKAIYGVAYYDEPRRLHRALREFATSIEGAKSQAVVAVVFGLGGGTGSGIAMDLARHLSTVMFGRRLLVTGVGIAPCGGDIPEHRGGQLFAALNELDCLGDESKNRGVVASCGELFRNPFTAGFFVVPQQHIWERTKDLELTRARGNREIAALLAAHGGSSLWETLRLLNWVAAPSTQHSAARTPWGPKWIHMLGFADGSDHLSAAGPDLPREMGLLPSYVPEYIEARVSDAAMAHATQIAQKLEDAFKPEVPPQIIGGGNESSIQFILPSISKADLAAFYKAREAFDAEQMPDRVLDHSLLLDQGIVLSERSTRLEGMAGASLGGSESWIAVPFDDLNGMQNSSVNELDPHSEDSKSRTDDRR